MRGVRGPASESGVLALACLLSAVSPVLLLCTPRRVHPAQCMEVLHWKPRLETYLWDCLLVPRTILSPSAA